MKSATTTRCCEPPTATGLPRSSELCLHAGPVSLAASKLYTRAVLPPVVVQRTRLAPNISPADASPS
jgi:hypothetical protein